jgi:hypothetical protein
METEYIIPNCRIIKQISGKDFQCHKPTGYNTFEACPFGHCIDDDIEDATKVYSDKVIKILSRCIKKWQKKNKNS